jgi:ribosomal protein S12 methylthiotransferase accessory factor
MRSPIVVTSWWSNCLALTCLRQLRACAPGRELYVMQAGKSDAQMRRFRDLLPQGVTELPYPAHVAPDDSAMREYLAKEALRDLEGVWFFDHDAFLQVPAEAWFAEVDTVLSRSKACLCTRRPLPGEGVTQPAYWLSPRRWPTGLSSFSPVPFRPRPYARRPDLHRHDGNLAIPGKDTLVQVYEELAAMNLTGTFYAGDGDSAGHLLPPFPPHIHIGGLHLYTGVSQPPRDLPPAFFEWRRHTLLSFDAFFRSCPPEWLAIEEPELLRRHAEMMQTLEATGGGQLARLKPYKAVPPEDTIHEIRSRLKALGGLTMVEERVCGEAGRQSYCLRLTNAHNGQPIFQTMGKGRTDAYALASAYGEMIERIQNQAFYTMLMYPSEPEAGDDLDAQSFKYSPDEKLLTGDELLRGFERMAGNGGDAADLLHADTALGVPYWNVFTNRTEYLPFRAMQVIVGSNGMCSGNTPAEALIHGICEVLERHVLKQLFLSPHTPPDIPLELFAGHQIHDDLKQLADDAGYVVRVKDCSLGRHLPVVGLLLQDGDRRYAFHLGADPSPVTALERCLTEMYQGGCISFRDTTELEGASGELRTSEFWKTQLHLNIRSYEGHWPPPILGREADHLFQGFAHPVSATDEEDLDYVLDVVRAAGWDLLVRDNSFLGIPSYHVYIPGVGEMTNVLDNAFGAEYLAFDRHLPTLLDPAAATPVQRAATISAIERYATVAPTRQFRAADYLMHYRQHPLADQSQAELTEWVLQPSLFTDAPACFKCDACRHVDRCNYPAIAAICHRVKEAMSAGRPNC